MNFLNTLLRGGPSYQLPNTQAADGNVAVFQLTATLPLSFEVAFLGGPSAEQKTMGGPVTMCAGCSPSEKPKPESHSERLRALTGRSTLRCDSKQIQDQLHSHRMPSHVRLGVKAFMQTAMLDLL